LEEAVKPENCDQKWKELWHRFMGGVDWSDLEEYLETGWHRKQHIFEAPFYYVEYGMASLGASQVWANALKNQKGAVEAYRQALALGGTVSLPKLYETAGAKFSFDAATLQEAVSLAEEMIAKLEKV
jgi:oligoendopeptidase F